MAKLAGSLALSYQIRLTFEMWMKPPVSTCTSSHLCLPEADMDRHGLKARSAFPGWREVQGWPCKISGPSVSFVENRECVHNVES